jgi:hypothetical protein
MLKISHSTDLSVEALQDAIDLVRRQKRRLLIGAELGPTNNGGNSLPG